MIKSKTLKFKYFEYVKEDKLAFLYTLNLTQTSNKWSRLKSSISTLLKFNVFLALCKIRLLGLQIYIDCLHEDLIFYIFITTSPLHPHIIKLSLFFS